MKPAFLDYTNSIALDAKEIGITPALLNKYNSLFEASYKNLIELKNSGKYGFFDLPFRDVSHIKTYVNKNLDNFDNFVVLGIGGSALGNLMLHNALKPLYWNYFDKSKRNGYLRVFVIDNVDPELLEGLFDIIDVNKTLFNVITKSGTTTETMANFLRTLEVLKNAIGKEYLKHIVITTDKEKGILRKFAIDNNIDSFVVPDNVGGRFSVLSDVGLLSAAFEGIDIQSLLKGAEAMINTFITKQDNAVVTFCQIAYILYKEFNIRLSVLMPYSNHLIYFADWFLQLWAESLGKKFNRNSDVVNEGLTPIKAIGTTDQHSQIQLYNEGPKDKFITFIRIENHKADFTFREIPLADLSYLENHTMAELLNTEQIATADALKENNVPNATIILPELNEYYLGKMIMFFELATAYMAELLDINAFDQPGVEHAKKLTYALMGRKGFEKLREDYNDKKAKKSVFTIEV